MSRRKKRPIRWRVEYAAVRLLQKVVRSSSPAVRLRISRSVGRLAFRIAGTRRRTALKNLDLAYPQQPHSWREHVARKSFEHLGRLLGELAIMRSGTPPPVTAVIGWEHLERIASGGYFLVSAHFGNWEVMANAQASRGYPMWLITRRSDNPLLERDFAALREAAGNRVIHKAEAAREIVRGLKSGKGVAIVIDQNYRAPDAHFVPFFGRLASTSRSVGVIAQRMNVPVITAFGFPQADGTYTIEYDEPVIPDPNAPSRDEEALRITREVTQRVERAIRRQPEAWFWMHDRWRTRPPGESS